MKGICFVEDLFLQVVTGHKVETRRTGGLKQVNENPNKWKYVMAGLGIDPLIEEFRFDNRNHSKSIYAKPRYQPGDILYIKEPYGRISGVMFYAFDYLPRSEMRTTFKGWANKLFMSASDARHFIKIVDVWVERAWDITEEGAIREGVANRAEFEKKWAKINGISSWKPNPYVFVYQIEYLPNYKI